MSDEQLYMFVDKSGHCFEDFQSGAKKTPQDETDRIVDEAIKPDENGEARYRDHVGAMLRAGTKFSVGDMLAFRDDLIDAGFRWGKDFYAKKI